MRTEPPIELAPADLRWRCDPATFGFATTAEVPPLEQLVGQDRAVDAISFALGIEDPRYNLFVAGPVGTGRVTTIRRLVERSASARPRAADWCYLHNFADPYRPIAVELDPGQGPELVRDLGELTLRCRTDIPRALESTDYERRHAALVQEAAGRRDAILSALVAAAETLGFGIEVSPAGIVSGPVMNGKPLGPEAFALLPEAKRAEIANNAPRVRQAIDDALPALRQVEREGHERLHALEREVALFTVGHVFDALRAKYGRREAVLAHLTAVRDDLLEHIDEIRAVESPAGMAGLFAGPPFWERYGANLLLTHDGAVGAPVVFEPNPTFANLVGRVDYRMTVGMMQTDFRFVKAGALHRANGGFLVLQARDLLGSPYAYEALKRALRDREIRVENPSESMLGLPAATLKPAPIPLRVRVILVGDSGTYALLLHLDADFAQLFSVKAEFTSVVDRTRDSMGEYASFVSARVKEHGLLPFAADAIAAIVEEGARIVAHQGRLSARFDVIERLVIDTDRWARAESSTLVHAEHVMRALRERDRRASLPEEEFHRLITDGTLVVDTRARIVGQVNGLAVMDYGDRAFARPSRITARSGVGTEGVVDVERESLLSGPTHSKGVLILTGYLLGTYGRERSLALSARLTFEQLYGGVEGDSASAAELFAILSSIADIPIDQGVAVTGSIDQYGAIQAIGAVNEKIEGHFAVCRAQGLSGTQGVLIPRANARHLMLSPEVVEAVAGGRFHVWAIGTVEEGMAVLTGLPGAEVHAKVAARLADWASRLAAQARKGAER